MNRLKECLHNNQPAFGTFVTLKDPTIVEMLGWSGFDFAVFDFEHTEMDFQTLTNMVRAAELSGLTPLARIGYRDFPMALRLVEAGIKGILAPHVTSAEYIHQLTDVIRYRPSGDRGIDPSTRSARHGLADMSVRLSEPSDVMCFALIEDKEGIENIRAIAETGKLDGVMLGPSDLARSYDVAADVSHPRVLEAIAQASSILTEMDIPIWRAGFDKDTVKTALNQGVKIITSPPVDSYFISRALRDHLESVREVTGA